VNKEIIYFSLEPNRLIPGKVVNFNIYVKSYIPGGNKEEYSLFLRCGEVFNPGHLAKIKFKHIRHVYYQLEDKDNVQYYLDQDINLIGDTQSTPHKKKASSTPVIENEIYIPFAVYDLQPGTKIQFDLFKKTKNPKTMDYSYKIIISKGANCEESLIHDLKREEVKDLYFRKQDGAEVLQYRNRNRRMNAIRPDIKFDISQQELDVSKIAPGFEEVEGYASLPLRNLTPGLKVPFDVFVKTITKEVMKPNYVKCCERGDVFQEDWHLKLQQMGIPCVYLSLQEIDEVQQYLYHNIEMVLEDENQDTLKKGVRICDATHMWTFNFYNSEEARTANQVKAGLKFLDTLFKVIGGDHHNFLSLTEIKYHSFHLYTHCLNVCLLGLAFTIFLGWSWEKIQEFALGALIHDIGLTKTPRGILEKKGPLTQEEMSQVKRHPLEGVRMLQASTNLSWESLQMIMQHHENSDGSGYPEGLKIDNIHDWARILRILDTYEAMTAERPWRPAKEPKEVLWVMRKDWEKGKVFDRNYVKTFILFLADISLSKPRPGSGRP
jgi:HD-GYP domain-containing protein (c-di-GMP phosphodiesterase class II)